MPSEFSTLDTSFPNLEGKTTEQKLQSMTDYLYQLLEQLRYTLRNLGVENFNETSLNEITEPIYADIRDVDGNVAELDVLANEIKGQVTDAQGNYTVMNLKSDGLHIGNASGTTTISGSSITTGSITTNQIQANTIQLGDLSSGVTNSFGDPNPAYIKSTYIDFRQVVSPAVYAGDFYGAQYHDLNGYGTLYIMGSQAGYYTLYFGPPSANPGILDAKFGVRVLGDGTLELYLNGLKVMENGLDNGAAYTSGEGQWRFNNMLRLNHHVILKQNISWGSTLPTIASGYENEEKGRLFFKI